MDDLTTKNTNFTLIAGVLNNRQDPMRLGVLSGEADRLTTLVVAQDMDFDKNGKATLRRGRELILSAAAHSFWVHPFNDKIAYFVEDSILYKLETDYSTVTVATLQTNARMVYEPVNEEIVITNGTDIGWLHNTIYDAFNTQLGKFEIPTPAGQYLSFYKGVLHILRGSSLFTTKPMNIMVMDKRFCEFQLDGYGRMIGAVEDGIWVATEKAVGFIRGKKVDDYVFEHKTNQVPANGCFMVTVEEKEQNVTSIVSWASPEGFCRGYDNGAYENLSVGNIALPEGSEGSLFRMYNNGTLQYLAVINEPKYARKYVPPSLDIDQ
jgi:hypothetical protein